MSLNMDRRQTDSPFLEMVWHSQSDQPGTFTSTAENHWEMVVTRCQGRTTFTVRGPETRATFAEIPPNAEFYGIVFKLGVYMPHLSLTTVLDRQDITLPEATNQSFWLLGSAWQIPHYDDIEIFVSRMARQGLLAHDPVVDAVLQGHEAHMSPRNVRRHFLHATGLTPKTIQQIERARQAVTLLEQGVSILDTIYETGYFDQPHLTRSLKHYFGQTPAQIASVSAPE